MSADPRDASPTSDGERTAPPAAPDPPPPVRVQGNTVEGLVREIRDELAQFSATELERRREDHDLAQRYRALKEAAEQAATSKIRELRQRITEQQAELAARARSLQLEQRRLEQLADRLHARQAEIDQQHREQSRQIERMRAEAEDRRERQRHARDNLRSRIAALRSYEAQLRARYDAARDDLRTEEARLARREQALHAEAESLAAEREHLRQRRQEDAERQDAAARDAAGVRQQANLEARGAQMESHRAALARMAAELERDRSTLEARDAELRERAMQVEKHRVLLEGERASLAQARHELESDRVLLTAQQEDLAEARQLLERERSQLDAHRDQVATQAGELDGAQLRLAHERASLAALRDALEETRLELDAQRERQRDEAQLLDQQRKSLAEREKSLDEHWRSTHDQRHALAHELESIDARRRALEQEQRAFQDRVARLEERELRFREKLAALKAEQERLGKLGADLQARAAAAPAATRKIDEEDRRAWQKRMAEAEARDAETRQAALTLEVERGRVEQLRAGVEAQQRVVAAERAVLEKRMRRVREAGSPAARPAVSGLRRVGLALVLGVAAGVAWFFANPPWYTAERTARIEPPATPGTLLEHRQALSNPQTFASLPGSGAWLEPWESLLDSGQATVSTDEQASLLRVRVHTRDRLAACDLLRAVGDVYADVVNDRPPAERLPAAYHDRVAERDRIRQAIEHARTRRNDDAAALAGHVTPEARDNLRAQAAGLQSELEQVVAALQQHRGELAAMVATPPVAPLAGAAAIDAALATDEIYQEDQREFRAVAVQYRSELTVAMMQLVEPLGKLRQALTKYAATIAEQRGLDPPAGVQTVLEQAAAQVAALTGTCEAFAGAWQQAIEQVRAMDAREQVADLVRRQHDATIRVQQTVDAAQAAVRDLGETIAALDTTAAGGTREVVVAAVLRGEQESLAASVDGLRIASAHLSLAQNVELDARDRKLRGLRMRLDGRRAAVRERLQLELEQAAAAAHATKVDSLREQVQQQEQQRESLVSRLLSASLELGNLEDALRARQSIVTRIEQRDGEIAWLETREAALSAEIDDMLNRHRRAERVVLDDVRVVSSAEGRYRDAAAAGAAACLAAWLLSTVFFARRGRTNGAERPPSTPPPAASAPAGDAATTDGESA